MKTKYAKSISPLISCLVLTMVEYTTLTQMEIAHLLNISQPTVSNIVNSSLQKYNKIRLGTSEDLLRVFPQVAKSII